MATILSLAMTERRDTLIDDVGLTLQSSASSDRPPARCSSKQPSSRWQEAVTLLTPFPKAGRERASGAD